MDTIRGFHTVRCSCGSVEFARPITLRWHAQFGLSEQIEGYVCLKCNQKLNVQSFRDRMFLDRQKRTVEELTKKIAEQETNAETNAETSK